MEKYSIVLVIVLILGFSLAACFSSGPKVEPGQIWVYESSDPFNPICVERLVLDVKDGYVQYKDSNSGYTHSMELWLFEKNSHLKLTKKRNLIQ